MGVENSEGILAPKIIDRLRHAYRLGLKMAFGTDTVIEVPNNGRSDLMLGLSRRLARSRSARPGDSEVHDLEPRRTPAHQPAARDAGPRPGRGHCRYAG